MNNKVASYPFDVNRQLFANTFTVSILEGDNMSVSHSKDDLKMPCCRASYNFTGIDTTKTSEGIVRLLVSRLIKQQFLAWCRTLVRSRTSNNTVLVRVVSAKSCGRMLYEANSSLSLKEHIIYQIPLSTHLLYCKCILKYPPSHKKP